MQEKNILYSFLQLLQTAVITDTYSLWDNVGFKELAQGSKPCVPRIWVVDSHTVRQQISNEIPWNAPAGIRTYITGVSWLTP